MQRRIQAGCREIVGWLEIYDVRVNSKFVSANIIEGSEDEADRCLRVLEQHGKVELAGDEFYELASDHDQASIGNQSDSYSHASSHVS